MSRKNVITVGNAGNIINGKNGKFIDSADFVVRMGNCATRGYEEYIGSKTDMYRVSWDRLLHNINKTGIYRPIDIHFTFKHLLFLEQNINEHYETTAQANVKRLTKLFYKPFFTEMSFNSFVFTKNIHPFLHESCLSYFNQKYKVQAVEYMKIQDRVDVFMDINTPQCTDIVIPSSGILTLYHILKKFPNENHYILGFDGFQTRYYWRDYETFFEGHSSYREQMYLKRLIKTGRINVL